MLGKFITDITEENKPSGFDKDIVIEEDVWVGCNVTLLLGVHIGRGATIAAGAVVNKDIPPYIKAGRLPVSYAGVNSIGLRRRGFTNEQISEIQEIYRYLYLSGLNNSDAVDRIEAELPASKERDEIIMFVRNSKRGIIRGYY